MDIKPYNPLDKKSLGDSVADALLESPVHSLGELKKTPFSGAGIYVIYYTGKFKPYGPLSAKNSEGEYKAPIYVGKAVPPGARKGNFGLEEADPGRALHNRLSEHAESVKEAENLNLEDFFCRFLVVDDIWIPLGESLLIAKFSPIWNKLVDGFGNHDPGKGRYNQMRSKWDTIHPGRAWASKCAEGPDTIEQIYAAIKAMV